MGQECGRRDQRSDRARQFEGRRRSAAAYYRDGRLVQAISRGDGTVGEDITANALRFKGLPAWVGDSEEGAVGFTGAVRFEVVLTVADWTAIDPARSKNPRNAGTGIMGRKNGHQSDCLTIFAFDLDETRDGRTVQFATETDKTARLAQLGFNLIPQQRCVRVDEAVAYFEHIAATRDALPLWIDGVVIKLDDIALQRELGVTSGRPKGQVAWKFDSSGGETVLLGVVVSGGHTGGLYPTAQLAPVEIGGTTVSNASLANYDEIERLDVAIGDSVWVVKANDIIPKIIRVTDRPATRTPILAPLSCPFCGGDVGRRLVTSGDEGVIIECRNPACAKKSTGKISRWIASLDILGIGDVVLEAMVDQLNLADAADLYTLRERQAEMADLVTHAERDLRLGDKRAASILQAIDATRSLTLSRFLGSLGLDFLGKRRVELMINNAGGTLARLDDWRLGKLRDADFAAQAGVPSIGSQIQDGIDAMAPVIDKLLAAGVVVLAAQPPESISDDGAAPRQTVCISGKLPSGRKKHDYAESLHLAGYALVDEVSRGLNFLVLADAGSTSSKAEKASKLGVAVISESQLIEMVAAGASVLAVQEPSTQASPAPPATEPAAQAIPTAPRPTNPSPKDTSMTTTHHAPASGKTLCISGKLPSGKKKADYEAPLRAVGIELVDDVIKGLSYLVLADPASTSSKADKARKLGVEVISEEQLQARISQSTQVTQIGVETSFVALKVIRSDAVKQQVEQAVALRSKLIAVLSAAFSPVVAPVKRKAKMVPKESDLLQLLELSAEGWRPIVETISVKEVDRTLSMLAGPLFTSAEYPIPTRRNFMLMPLVQLDLRQFAYLGEPDLGDGLFQLWCDPNFRADYRAFIRVIPRTAVQIENITYFDFIKPAFDVTPINWDLEYDPNAKSVKVISGFESLGVQCQARYLEIYAENLDEAIYAEISDDLKKYKEITEFASRDVQLLGSFYPIQYTATEISSPCLMSFANWGSSGNSQVFYSIKAGGILDFRFEESLR